jgi:hypothetical protein
MPKSNWVFDSSHYRRDAIAQRAGVLGMLGFSVKLVPAQTGKKQPKISVYKKM